MPYDELPLVVALTAKEPRHASLMITGFDGIRRQIESTCFPLMASGDKVEGGVVIFWEESEPATGAAIPAATEGQAG